MKEKIRKYFLKKSIIDLVRYLYIMLKTARLYRLYYELLYRLKGTPDGYPLPPSKLIYLVIDTGWAWHYFKGGQAIVEGMLGHFKRNSIDVNRFKKILEIGCGCGRLIRRFTFIKDVELYGSDINKDQIDWCKNNLNFGKFQVNNLKPPLNYESNMFDFIYLRSVFTHLSEEMQKNWIAELSRILKPNGILLFTTMGSGFVEQLTSEQKKSYEKGKLVCTNVEYEGTNQFESFASPKFVKDNLLDGFELVDYVFEKKTKDARAKQDIYILRKQGA